MKKKKRENMEEPQTAAPSGEINDNMTQPNENRISGLEPEISDGPDTKEEVKQEEKEKKCPEERIRGIEQELAEMRDKYLRLYAEFDNYRKRTMKERSELFKTAEADLITLLLPVLDDMERAEKSSETTNDLASIKEGNLLIQNKFNTILTQKGLKEIPALGEVFNTDIHEAIANVATDKEEEKGKVHALAEKGYTLNGKVIRFAKVVVSI